MHALAVKINENTGEHGVTATFNEVVSTMYAAGVDSNGTTVKSRATVEEFIAAVNDEIANNCINEFRWFLFLVLLMVTQFNLPMLHLS